MSSSEEGSFLTDSDDSDPELSDSEPSPAAGAGAGSDDDHVATKKPKKKKVVDPRFVAPTAHESSLLRTTREEDADMSGPGHLLHLELTELLKDASPPAPDSKSHKAVTAALHALKAALTSVPAQSNVTSTPPGLPLRHRANRGTALDFAPPSAKQVTVVGSFMLHTMAKPGLHVDVAVEMPAACFTTRDVKNHTYTDKRALYLGVLAGALATNSAFRDVRVVGLHNDASKPVLAVGLSGAAKAYTLRVLPCVHPSVFKPTMLTPAHNNVRRRTHADAPQPATPVYNASILEDMCMAATTAAFHEALGGAGDVAQGVVLLKRWAAVRGLTRRPDSFSGFLLTALAIHLVHRGVLTAAMAPHQALRAVLQFLASTDLRATGSPITLCPGVDVGGFTPHYDCVIVGPTGTVNLASRVTYGACLELRAEAEATLVGLGLVPPPVTDAAAPPPKPAVAALDEFYAAFEQATPPVAAFDRLLAVPVPAAPAPGDDARSLLNQNALCDLDWPRVVERRVFHYLTTALTDRAAVIRVLAVTAPGDVWGSPPVLEWGVGDAPPSWSWVWVGLRLRAAAANRSMDRGPPADRQAEARAFRAFWGEKAELHRFPDGTILESVDWGLQPATAHHVVHAIVSHTLHRHMGMPPGDVKAPYELPEALLELPHVSAAAEAGDSHPDGYAAATRRAVKAVDELSEVLRHLKGVPLTVTDVQGTSPGLRYTSLHAPLPHPLVSGSFKGIPSKAVSRVVDPLKLVVTLERSMKWPDDLGAIRATKTAFYLKIKYGLKAHHGVSSVTTREFVDVLFKGYAFRVILYHPRELTLLERFSKRSSSRFMGLAGTPVMTAPETTAVINVAPVATPGPGIRVAGAKLPAPLPPARATQQANALRRECVLRPQHTAAVRALVGRHPSFPGAVRLSTRWLAAHMFGDHLAAEAVELLVARVYVHPAPFTPPTTPVVGFLRFLNLVASRNWASTPMLVNVNGDAMPSDFRTLESRFKVIRGSAAGTISGPALFLVTPLNRGKWSPSWTATTPSTVVLRRLMVLAGASAIALSGSLLPLTPPGALSAAFTPRLGDFHATVRLAHQSVPRCDGRWHGAVVPFAVDAALGAPGDEVAGAPPLSQFVVRAGKGSRPDLLVGFNPVRLFLDDVRSAHGKQLMAFWNPVDPTHIGIVFKAADPASRAAVLQDVLALGSGLVRYGRLA